MNLSRRRLLFCLGLIGVAGCGGSDNGGTSPTPSPSPSPSPSTTPTAGLPKIMARAYQRVGSQPQIFVTWEAPTDIATTSIIEYQIYRDSQIIGVATPNNRAFYDSIDLPTPLTYNTVAFGGAAISGTSPASTLQQITTPVTALAFGAAHIYSLQVVYQRAGSPGNFATTALGVGGGPVTALNAPSLIGPTTDQPITNLSLVFATVQGADTYVLEFSADPNLADKVVRGPFSIVFATTATTSDVIDIATEFPNATYPAGTRIYCRVGCKNAADALPPLTNAPHGDNYIYSNVLSFAKIGNPPTPPTLP